jgi:rSAM/selenodomain-associated transferase 1
MTESNATDTRAAVSRQVPQQVLGMLVKYSEPGQVKTRLGASLVSWSTQPVDVQQAAAMTAAADIHQLFLCHLLRALSQAGDVRELVGSPSSRLADFHRFLLESGDSAWQVTDQGLGNLGDRIKRWFLKQIQTEKCASEHAVGRAAVLIGADCPLISTADLDLAWSHLTHQDIVLGPAHDGGYYLIGLSDRLRDVEISLLFEGIAWSTPAVLNQTLAVARKMDRSVALLQPRHDVDNAEDLRHLMRSLVGGDEHSRMLLDQLCDLELPGIERP